MWNAMHYVPYTSAFMFHCRTFLRYVKYCTIYSMVSDILYSMHSGWSSARNGYPGTRVATRYPGTRSGSGYPVIFITRLLSTQHMPLWLRIWCYWQRISQKFNANLHATAIMTARLISHRRFLQRSIYRGTWLGYRFLGVYVYCLYIVLTYWLAKIRVCLHWIELTADRRTLRVVLIAEQYVSK